IKVVVVDDEADAIALVKRIMEDCGASVQACTSGAECLACIPTFRPDVLITDIGMLDMDGYTLIKTLRAMQRKGVKPPLSPSPPLPARTTGDRRCSPGLICTSPSQWNPASWWRSFAGPPLESKPD